MTTFSGIIDARRLSPFQYGVMLLCGLVMFLDGFNTQTIPYAAPYLAKEWGVPKALLGPIFSSALAGLMIGYLALAPLADRIGHRRMIVGATLCFGLATLLSVWARGVSDLIMLRLVAGIGLGACMPSAVALTSEFCPTRVRATAVLVIYCGFSLGFVASGVAASWLIPAFGWRAIFIAGALAPLLLLPPLIIALPESPAFLLRTHAPSARLATIVRRIDPAGADIALVAERSATRGAHGRLADVLVGGRLMPTLALWVVFAINLGAFYAMQSWLPTVLADLGYTNGVVVTATALTTAGGIAIVPLVGPAMDRLGAFRALTALYAVGWAFVAWAGLSFGAALPTLYGSVFLAGCVVSGGQKSVIALAALLYPVDVRSTGVGWALGIGRVGGILGPLAFGAAYGAGWTGEAVFIAMAAFMLACGLIVAWLSYAQVPLTRARPIAATENAIGLTPSS